MFWSFGGSICMLIFLDAETCSFRSVSTLIGDSFSTWGYDGSIGWCCSLAHDSVFSFSAISTFNSFFNDSSLFSCSRKHSDYFDEAASSKPTSFTFISSFILNSDFWDMSTYNWGWEVSIGRWWSWPVSWSSLFMGSSLTTSSLLLYSSTLLCSSLTSTTGWEQTCTLFSSLTIWVS